MDFLPIEFAAAGGIYTINTIKGCIIKKLNSIKTCILPLLEGKNPLNLAIYREFDRFRCYSFTTKILKVVLIKWYFIHLIKFKSYYTSIFKVLML